MGINASQRRRMNEGLSRSLSSVAKSRQCRECGRKMAMERFELEDGVAYVCRWEDCGYKHGYFRTYPGVQSFEEAGKNHGKPWKKNGPKP